MPGPRLFFPQDIQDPQQGHWMNIIAVGRGSDNTPQATVSLFIPGGINGSNMIWSHNHDYAESKMNKIVMSAAAAAVGIGGGAVDTIAGAAGGAINPKVEVLYRNTQLRTFQFNFIMSPSSALEATTLKQIVKYLRGFSSPTLYINNGFSIIRDIFGIPIQKPKSDPRAGYVGSAAGQADYLSSGGLYESPSEFLIDFYYLDKGGVHQLNYNIPRIGRCIIEHIEINYTPTGEWSTFHDGNPTSAQLTMVFREMRIIDQANILSDPTTEPSGGY